MTVLARDSSPHPGQVRDARWQFLDAGPEYREGILRLDIWAGGCGGREGQDKSGHMQFSESPFAHS